MAAPSLDDLPASFELYLRATNKSRRTIETYREALDGFTAHLQATSKRPLDQARREDVEAWMTVLLARWKPATARNRYRGLHAFYRWLEEEEDIPSPMARMRPPTVPEQPIPILDEQQLRTLFAVCAGKDFDARRDTALLMMLLDAGHAVGPLRHPPAHASGRAPGRDRPDRLSFVRSLRVVRRQVIRQAGFSPKRHGGCRRRCHRGSVP